MAQDIVLNKCYEHELRRRDEEFLALIDDSPDLVSRYDKNGVIVYSNCSTEELLRAEITGCDKASVSAESNHMASSVLHVLETGLSCEYGTSHAKVDGSMRFFHKRLTPEFNADGDVIGVISVSRDVTALKETFGVLRNDGDGFAEEREYRALVENSPDALARFDRDARFVYVNTTFEKWTGISREYLLGKMPNEVTSLHVSELLQSTIMGVIRNWCRDEFEHVWELTSDSVIWCHVNVVPEFDINGDFTSVIVSSRDISSLKEAEKKVCESRDLLRKLSSKRELESDHANRSVAWEIYDTLGQNLMMLRMKLSNIYSGIISLSEKSTRTVVAEMLDLADNSIKVVRTVSHELRPITLDLGIDVALDWLADKCTSQSGVKCTSSIEMPSGFNMNKLSAVDVFRVAEQAVNNAAVHANARWISIKFKPVRDSFLLEVRDDGIGFDLDEHWENGLGLLDMRERAHRLGGELVFFTRVGGGTVVELLVPARMLVADKE